LQIKAHLGDAFEKVFLGHLISGHLNFPRRIATTYLNASVYPVHKEFFEAVQQSLEARGLTMPIRILKADGGNMNFASSIEFPGQTILSGPSASVMGAVAYASNAADSLVLDIGGTTTDITILRDGVPLLAPLGIDVGGYRTLIRSLDTHSIGVGGDSLVRLSNQRLEIGPERLGPAMAHGGPVPTPTDAFFVLNKVEDGDRDMAVKGIEPLAAVLDLSVEEAAVKIVERTCAKIIKAANTMLERLNSKPVYTIHEIQEGIRLQPQQILILGGPAPYFAEELERQSEMEVGVVPKWSVANAIGAVVGRVIMRQSGTVTSPGEGKFRVHLDAGPEDFGDPESALALLETVLTRTARERAKAAGAAEIEVQVSRNIRTAGVEGREVFVEADVTVEASGRPRVAVG